MDRTSLEAAFKAHPQLAERPDGSFRWNGGGEMPTEARLIDRFQVIYPSRAVLLAALVCLAGNIIIGDHVVKPPSCESQKVSLVSHDTGEPNCADR